MRPALGVDVRGALGVVGILLRWLSPALLVPTVVALAYGEPPWPFLAALAIGLAVAFGLERLGGGGRRTGQREGFLVISLMWVAAPALGALPLLLAGEAQLARPVDAYFEAMSGFTATGATVVPDVEALERSLLVWRQLTQWLGGLGIIVLALAVLPRLRVGGRQIFESELPGPELDPIVARIGETARRVAIVYVGLTVTTAALLGLLAWTNLDASMTAFDAIGHALTSVPTGGFSTRNESFLEFGAATQWLLVAVMAVAGINYALLYRAFVRRSPSPVTNDEELRFYGALLVFGSVVLSLELLASGIHAGEEAIRHGAFQAVAIMTGTGYASSDFDLWTPLAAVTLVGLMFVGGSAGSTTGSVKVVRHLLMAKILRRELQQTVHPELVSRVRFNRRVVDERILRSVTSFVLLYVGIFALGAFFLAIDASRADIELAQFDAIAAAAATLGNVGPGFGIAGPTATYEPFSDLSTIVMTGLMWLGRLEVIPVVVLATRSFWRT